MSALATGLCHECSCHINPPCGQCENCNHPDGDLCPEGDCQNCECVERPVYVPYVPTDADRFRWMMNAWRETVRYRCKPYSRKEWGYASVTYTIRPEVNGERLKLVVDELIASHTYFGHRMVGRSLTIFVD